MALAKLHIPDEEGAVCAIREADWPAPFVSGLEYGAPARGPWNIVHIGMLIPESHQVFVCAQGCLRGVVLTAAEMGASERFSTITVKENNLLDGDMEQLMIDGVDEILSKLPYRPKAVLVFTSCVHHFSGCDLNLVYRELRRKHPDVDFTDCYMTPILRKSKITPDALMRKQLYSLLHQTDQNPNAVNLIGNNVPTDGSSELITMLAEKYKVRDICSCHSYDEYQEMAESAWNISYNPAAGTAGQELEQRLGQKHLYLPLSYDYEEIKNCLQRLADALKLKIPDVKVLQSRADATLADALASVGNLPIAIDYTATPRPLGLAKLLLEHGFYVTTVYADSFIEEERPAFDWLRLHAPELKISATVHAKMCVLPKPTDGKILAIGQKAAWFSATRYFVNLVEGGGHYGFNGICRLAAEISQAAREEKDTQKLIQIKGWGCCG